MKLRPYTDGFLHYCPGCESMHAIPVRGRVAWTYREDPHGPTFLPSVRHKFDFHDNTSESCCHYFITDGQIEFQNDCTHALKGRTVPLPDVPDVGC